jgi:capsular exopolysaccharide synthesis family protein
MGKKINTLNENEIDLKELIETIYQYRWSLLSIIVIALIWSSSYIYFKTPMYSSSATIEIKSNGSQVTKNGDIIGSTFSSSGKQKVDKEIEILKTYHINNLALNKLDFNIQYFIDSGFKKTEIYHNSPIIVKELTILNLNILWKMIKISPVKNGYTLEVQNSFKKKISHLLFGKTLVELDTKKIYPYNEKIKTKYFEFILEKKNKFTQPIYINLKGNNRLVYEGIIHQNTDIFQINPEASLIQVIYKDNIPQRANVYIDTLLDVFIEQSIAEKSKRINGIINFIDQQLTDIKTKLDNSEKKLEEYRIKNQAIDPKLQAQTYIKELSRIEIELSQNDLKSKLINNLLQFGKTQNIDAIAPSLMELQDQSTLDLVTKLQDAQIKEEGLKTQYSEKYPGLIAVRKQIKYIKTKIRLNLKNLKTSMINRNDNLLKLKKSYDKNLESLPVQERTLINLKRDYEISSKTYNYLLKKKSENEMRKVAILSDYRIVDPAYNNHIPISPKPFFILLVGLILGTIFGILQALVRHYFDDKIHTKNDIETLTTLPLYGILPEIKQKNIKIEVYKNPKSPFSESYRSLRTNLQFLHKETKGKIVLLTSTIMGEGKTTTAANLSTIFQMANYKVIVINLDMRKPTLHHYFDVDNTHGISTYLSSKNSITDIIKSTAYDNLDIITSGPIPPNPSELILSERLEELLDNLRETYDYIIIDSAPLGLVSDTMKIMQHSDINLILVRENYSKKSFISDLNHLVEKHNLKHIGLVLNAVNITSSSGYGYGYGYGYGQNDT